MHVTERRLKVVTAGGDEPFRLTWWGLSTVLIELDGVRLLTDPVLSRRMGFRPVVGDDVEALRNVDAVLISNVHRRHLHVPSLRLFHRSTRILVPRGAGCYVRRLGFAHVVELMSDDEWRIGAVRVRSVHAEHDAKRFPLSRSIPALGYVVSGSGRVYFAGSTDLFDGMSRLGDAIDVALLPVAPWSAKPARGRLDPGRGAIAVKRLRPRFAIPIQWGTSMRFAVPADPAVLRKPAEEFARALADAAPEVTACILPFGGSLKIEVPLAEAR